jgi:hypothetical protein
VNGICNCGRACTYWVCSSLDRSRHGGRLRRISRSIGTRWPSGYRTYREGGLPALLTYKEAGAPAGQKSLPAAVFAQLQARLASPSGFASYGAIQQWLREEFALEVPYKTLHGIVHYQLKAKRKRPRPSHAKKKRLRPRILSSSVRAPWGPSPP